MGRWTGPCGRSRCLGGGTQSAPAPRVCAPPAGWTQCTLVRSCPTEGCGRPRMSDTPQHTDPAPKKRHRVLKIVAATLAVILVLGSDTRQGKGNHIGGATPGLSDTAILLHLSADRKHAYGVSIPRDSMVQRPSCPRKDGNGTDPGGLSMFNEAYAVGGPACTQKTVEQLTGIRIDHFVVIDFNGFREMVDALGGVRV